MMGEKLSLCRSDPVTSRFLFCLVFRPLFLANELAPDSFVVSVVTTQVDIAPSLAPTEH